MTTTYQNYYLIKRVEEVARNHGLKLVPSNHGSDEMALVPFDDNLPAYSRTAELAAGTIDYLDSILRGWDIATSYYTMLKLVTTEKIKAAEDKCRHDRLARTLATGKDVRDADLNRKK